MVTRKHLGNKDVVQVILILPASRTDNVGELAKIFSRWVKVRNNSRVG